MAEQQPQSRPEAPKPSARPGAPEPRESVYGGQWGSSGKQKDTGAETDETQPDRPKPIETDKQS